MGERAGQLHLMAPAEGLHAARLCLVLPVQCLLHGRPSLCAPGLGSPGRQSCVWGTGANISAWGARVEPCSGREWVRRPTQSLGEECGAALIPFYLIAVYKIVFVYRINCREQGQVCACVCAGDGAPAGPLSGVSGTLWITGRPQVRLGPGAGAVAGGERHPQVELGAPRAAAELGGASRGHPRCAAPAPPAPRLLERRPAEQWVGAHWNTSRPDLRGSQAPPPPLPGRLPSPAPAGSVPCAPCPRRGALVSSALDPRGELRCPAAAAQSHWGWDKAR